jgi:RNA polymerase sigma-70 factor (ECF subfamily)
MEMADLIHRFNNGDEQALKLVFDEFFAPLVNFAAKITCNWEEGKDVANDAFQKLWERHANFKTKENIRAFLFITVRNSCLNYLKSEERKRKAQKEIRYTSDENTHESIEDYVHVKMSNADDLQRFNEAVEALPAQCKAVFKLICLGYSNSEIAAKLNTSINTVEVQKNRALNKLRVSVMTKQLLKPH